MTSARWERVKQIVGAALERPEAERPSYIAKACENDEELRRDVESLLGADHAAGGFMQTEEGRRQAVAVLNHAVPATSARPGSVHPPTFSPDQVICGRFQVVRFLGRGGMGEVYEARDLHLRERVALKTVRPEIASDPKALARFNEEIRIARRVTHPNVCRIYDLEQCQLSTGGAGGPVSFLTMELLEGETLAERLKRGGRMGIEEAVPLARQMAEGLAAAHRAGIIHRDFKPGNVMLVPERPGTGERVLSHQTTVSAEAVPPAREPGAPCPTRAVITDFGLAKASEAATTVHEDARSLSDAPHLIGTPAYMAPEQLEHRQATSATDVYALGLVMYEMAAGRQPLPGDPYRRLRDRVPSPGVDCPGLDPRWQQVILKCLERQPGLRYADAGEVLGELSGGRQRRSAYALRAAVALGAVLAALIVFSPQVRRGIVDWLFPIPARKSLVVLPFRALDGSAEEHARCDGFTETVTAKLSELPDIEVAPAELVRRRHIDSSEKARREFGANLVLDASWQQRPGASARINLVLIEVDRGQEKDLRSQTITAIADSGYELQDLVVQASVQMLHLEPSPKSEQDLAAHGTRVASASDYYIQGIGYLQQYEKPQSLESAITLFQHAVDDDPGYAQAYAALAQAEWYRYTITRDPAWADRAKAAAQSAARLGRGLPEVLIAIGDLKRHTGDYAGAVTDLQQALSIDPNNVDAYQRLGNAYNELGRTDDAERAFREATRLRPSCWECYNSLGEFLEAHGRFPEASQAWQRIIDLAPDNPWGYNNVGISFLTTGNFRSAADYFARGLKLAPDDAELNTNAGTAAYLLGHYQEDVQFCRKAVSRVPNAYAYWGNLGDAYHMVAGDEADAAKAYREAISRARRDLGVNPNDSNTLAYLAHYYVRTGEVRPAGTTLEAALALKPADADTLSVLALDYLELGERPQALRMLQEAVKAGYARAMLTADPQWASLRSVPEFAGLVRQARAY
ncbi:MAG TPA: tetratricopeptide repeat protein [Terriglobia bacterium]|nr:tetratricopeptide repeat protein [Terriglobia bacterium]